MKEQKPEVRSKLVEEKKFSKDLDATLRACLAEFATQFKG